MNIHSVTVQNYSGAEWTVVTTGPQSYSTSMVMWLWSGCLVAHLHLGPLAKHPAITWLPFATFPDGFPKNSVGKQQEDHKLWVCLHLHTLPSSSVLLLTTCAPQHILPNPGGTSPRLALTHMAPLLHHHTPSQSSPHLSCTFPPSPIWQ